MPIIGLGPVVIPTPLSAPTTPTLIANMALGHVGVGQQIADITSELSQEANECNLFLQQALESTLADFNWPFATKFATLGLVTDNTLVTTPYDWQFAYRYPTDCVHLRRIVTSLGRKDPHPPPFLIGSDDQGRLVWTFDPFGVGEYTKRVTDYTQFPPLFAEAVSWRLAAFIAPPLSRIKDMDTKAMTVYLAILSKARVQAANEQQQVDEAESEFIRARDGGGSGGPGVRSGSFPGGFIVS
jgi:hypothetical protein